MFRYKAEDIKNPKNLTNIIERFKENEIPRFTKLERYFRVKNDIYNRQTKDGKPNNKLAHGFAKYISKMATGYFVGKPVRYIIESDDEDLERYKELLTEILDYNYTNNTNFEVAKEASKKGIAYEILYLDENGKLRTKKFNAEEIIPIYSQNIGEFLEAAIRIWSEVSFDGKTTTEYAALYTETEIITYAKKSNEKIYKQIETDKHLLSDIPVIVYWNNEEQTGDYEDVISLIDAYDKAQSDTANDSEYFADAYLYIIGASGGVTTGAGADEDEDEDPSAAYRTMRRERVLELDEKGQAGWLIKDVNDTAQENYKNRLYNNIFFSAQVPAMSDENFAGNLTGVAIRYKLIALEELTAEKENKFLSAQKKKIRIITEHLNEKYNKSFNADVVEIKTERNFIDNLSEIIERAEKLDGIISKETTLGILPIIDDVGEEMEKIAKEQTAFIKANDIYENLDFNIRKENDNETI